MSEISRSTTTAPKSPAGPTNRSQPGNTAEKGGDAFAALLSMVADTPAAADAEAGPNDATVAASVSDDEASDASEREDNPVAQLLGWADASPMDRVTASTQAVGAPAVTTPADEAAQLLGSAASGSMDLATASAPAVGAPAATPPTATAPAAVVGDTTGNNKPTGVDISGMNALAKPEAIDPASLPPGAAAIRAGAVMAGPAEGRGARAAGVRRDVKTPASNDPTTTLRGSAAGWQPTPVAAGRSSSLGGVTETARGRTVAWANSTVSMDLSASREADSVAGNAVSLTARLSELLTGRAQPDGAAPAPLLGATQEASSATSEGPSPTDLLPTPDAPADAEASPLSHWSAQQLRHAHLRLGDGGLDSLDIRLSMQGQDLSVDFRSDNADIRQSLAQQANQSLASLLERSGIALADVSVGAQSRQPGGQGASSDSRQGQGAGQGGRGAIGRDAAEPLARPLAQNTPRADGSRPLDLFV